MADEKQFEWQRLTNIIKSQETPQQTPTEIPTVDLSFLSTSEVQEKLTPLNSDVPEEEELSEDEQEISEEEELIEGELEPTVSFQLTGITLPEQPVTQPAGFDINKLFNPAATQIEQPVKRGRGRPPTMNKAENVLAQLPSGNTQQDLLKSTENIKAGIDSITGERISQIASLNKKTIKEIGEGIIRIGQALVRYAEE